jgi:shikimate dehydrogenase
LQYGIIGYPLSHTFSPAYFKKKFAALGVNATYQAFPLTDIVDLPPLLLAHPTLAGLNVTSPYKEAIMPYLREIDDTAATIGAANCLSIRNGYLKGHNTDAEGFEKSLVPLLKSRHSRALILGTGGSSKTVAYVLSQLGIPFDKVSAGNTPGAFTYSDFTPEIMDEYKLIINATPVGMYPDIDAIPQLPYEGIGDQHLLYDLIYNPEETQFLLKGKERGATIKNGFEMLMLQAEASWAIWSKYIPD